MLRSTDYFGRTQMELEMQVEKMEMEIMENSTPYTAHSVQK
jgi:hypothetical protein